MNLHKRAHNIEIGGNSHIKLLIAEYIYIKFKKGQSCWGAWWLSG